MREYSIRKVVPADAHLINRYWSENTDADLERMGESARPDPAGNIAFLEEFCKNLFDPRTAEEDIRMWCVNQKPIGYSTLKTIRYGIDGQIHLHMWDKAQRRKGCGSRLFCMSALEFIEAFHLKDLYCEPKADNPMPNGMLTKVGFPLLGPFDYTRRDGVVIRDNRYHIKREIAEYYLKARSG